MEKTEFNYKLFPSLEAQEKFYNILAKFLIAKNQQSEENYREELSDLISSCGQTLTSNGVTNYVEEIINLNSEINGDGKTEESEEIASKKESRFKLMEALSSIISKLENVELVLKDKTGDKYIYKTNYYIATDRIEFSSIPKDSKESEINLDEVAKGEYFVLLRMKYESSKTEEGYRYRYYTFNNQTQNNNLEYNGMNILFDSSESVSSYLTIEHK